MSPRLSEVIIRPAREEDYEGVLKISDGIYWGTDFVPAVYFDHLKDPNRVFYVAVYQNQVVTFTGGRVIDNGTVFEPEGSRTHPEFRDLGLYQIVRNAVINEGVLPKWPHLERIRVVTGGVEVSERKRYLFDIVPRSMRNLSELIWNFPKLDYFATLKCNKFQLNYRDFDRHILEEIGASELEFIFRDNISRKLLFPSDIVVRDSQSFGIGPSFLSNIPLLLGDRLNAIFGTRGIPDEHVIAMSFGTGIEGGVAMDMMRYCIDYYGLADMDVIKSHVLRHLRIITNCLEKSKTSKTVTCQFYALEHIFIDKMRNDLFDFVSEDLGFKHYVNRDREYHQIVSNVRENPRRLKTIFHKL